MYGIAVELQRPGRCVRQVIGQHACRGIAHDIDRPDTGNAATGVPHAIASISTRPNVSVRLGNTNASACW